MFDKDMFLTAEEKKLLVESYVNEKNGKLISGKTLRRLHSGRLSDLAGIFKMSDKEVETMFKKLSKGWKKWQIKQRKLI
ncbi:MAG TPA: hypothetical protein VJJ23_03910 [Candidatus Nanoarchaeia archaeon]|nr:hypothetical protein [Candidatus Nanoarchaeia archaeon]